VKKLIAPIVITVLICLWLLFYLAAVADLPEVPWGFRLVVGLISMGLGGVAIWNLYERIKEVRSGEEDDLDDY